MGGGGLKIYVGGGVKNLCGGGGLKTYGGGGAPVRGQSSLVPLEQTSVQYSSPLQKCKKRAECLHPNIVTSSIHCACAY
jgi:hypothetical protein